MTTLQQKTLQEFTAFKKKSESDYELLNSKTIQEIKSLKESLRSLGEEYEQHKTETLKTFVDLRTDLNVANEEIRILKENNNQYLKDIEQLEKQL